MFVRASGIQQITIQTVEPMNKIFLLAILALCASCMCRQADSEPVVSEPSDSIIVVEEETYPLAQLTVSEAQESEQMTVPVDSTDKSSIELMMESIGLVDIETLTDDIPVSLMYARDDNFTGKVMYKDLTRAYLHPEAAKALLNAQAELKRIRPDLSLKVYDAARPMSVQQIMWDAVKNTDQQIYVSNPAKGGGLHNYGLAVDVTLCDVATGDTLTMGTHIDYFGKRAQVRYEEEFLADSTLSREAYENRLILRKVMTAAGYKVLLSEWWHFNFKTRAEAKANYAVIP